MNTTREIENCTQTLINHLSDEYIWNDKMHETMDLESWKMLLNEIACEKILWN